MDKLSATEEVLRQVPLFANLPAAEIRRLAGTLRPLDVSSHTVLFEEGERGDHFYVVCSGKVDIVKALGASEERIVAVRGPGEFVGEMSLFDPAGVRTASVRAASDVQVLEMTRADFDELLRRQPALAYRMLRVLSDRLTAAHNNSIRDLQDKNRELLRAYEELKAAQAELVEKKAMERELQVAYRIQMGILPRELPVSPGFDFGARIVPMQAVGGDFYDFIPLAGDTLGIAVGDVSGHGVPAALFMALTVTLLRAEACRDCLPAEALRAVNRQLLKLNDAGLFVTLLYGVLDPASRQFVYARAGHESPMVWDANGRLIDAGQPHGQLLGLFDDVVLEEHVVPLQPGSTFLLYTDGVTEAADPGGVMFGQKSLEEIVRGAGAASAAAVCDHILEVVAAHRAGAVQRDDVTLVCVQADSSDA